MATIDNNTPQGEPVCDQQPISVQPGLAVILDTREIAKITEIVRKAKQSIESGHSSFRDGAGHFRDAAEYLAVAQELGVSQRKLADEVNKSPAWVNSLLGWRERGYPDRTPFTQRPPAKAVQQTEQSSRPALASPQCTRDAASTELTKTDKLGVGTDIHIQDEAEVAAPDHNVDISAADSNWTNNTFSAVQRGHLIEALEMLASDRPKYRAKHALVVEKRRAELGLTWDDLIIAATEAKGSAA